MACGAFFGSFAGAQCHSIAGTFGMQILTAFCFGLVAFVFCPDFIGSEAKTKKDARETCSTGSIFGRRFFLASGLMLFSGLFRQGRIILIPLVGQLKGYTPALLG